MPFEQTREVALNAMELLSLSDEHYVVQEEPLCVDLKGPAFEFVVVYHDKRYVFRVERENGSHEFPKENL